MNSKRYSLGILQSHPTQFDGPLFRLIAKQADIDLTVYYHSRGAATPSYDSELARPSGWDHDITSGYSYFILSHLSKERFFEIWRLCVLKQHDLLVIAGYNFAVTLGAAVLSRLGRTKTGLRADSVVIHRSSVPLSIAKSGLLRLLYRLYDTGHPVGSLASLRMQHYGMSEDRLFTFPYAVDHDFLRSRFALYAPNRIRLRQEMGITADAFVVLGVVKFVEREDPLTLVRAFADVYVRYPGINLILVGDGPLRSNITDFIQTANLDRVHLPGYIDYSELVKYFAVADVFVHPAIREPWGVSVNEAMVCGLPVIVSNAVGAGVDLVRPGITGSVFAAGDVSQLAREIETLALDLNITKEMGINALTVVEDWGYRRTVHELRRALEFISRASQ